MPGCDGLDPAELPACTHPGCPLARAPRAEIFVPAWVLPLQRLLSGRARGDLARAWAELPRALPAGVPMPELEEAAVVLLRLGLVRA